LLIPTILFAQNKYKYIYNPHTNKLDAVINDAIISQLEQDPIYTSSAPITYVNKNGDIMTGNLQVPQIIGTGGYINWLNLYDNLNMNNGTIINVSTITFSDGTILTSTATLGGGWVGDATSDLNMNNYNIVNVSTIVFRPYNSHIIIVSSDTDLSGTNLNSQSSRIIVIGFGNMSNNMYSDWDNSVSIGYNSYNNNYNSVSVGAYTYNNNSFGVGIGYHADNNYSWGVGIGINSNYNYNRGIGILSSMNRDCGIGIGMGSSYNYIFGIGIGNDSSSNYYYGIGIGFSAKNNHHYAIGIGYFSRDNQPYSTSVGGYTYSASSSVSLGWSARSEQVDSVSLGAGAKTTAPKSVSIGAYTINNDTETIKLGYKTIVNGDLISNTTIQATIGNFYSMFASSGVFKKECLTNGYNDVLIYPATSYVKNDMTFNLVNIGMSIYGFGYIYSTEIQSDGYRYYELRDARDLSLIMSWSEYLGGGAACPYVFIDGKLQGTILFNLNRIDGEGILFLKDVSNKITIKELEDEISYIEWVKLYKYKIENNKLKLLEEIPIVNSNIPLGDGYIILRRGDILEITFADFTLQEGERLLLKAKGFYVK
jgi:hypothetical protein